VVAEEGGIYTVHSRSYRWVSPVYPQEPTEVPHNRLSTLEQLDLARKSGVRLQLSHLLFHGRRTWSTYQDVIQDVERAAAEGVDVAFDAFPYTYGNTTITVNFPGWFMDGYSTNIDDPASLRRLKRELDYQHWLIGKGYGDIYLLWAGIPELEEIEGLDFSAIAQHLRMPEFEAYMHVARQSKGSARILQDTYSGDPTNEEPLQAILKHPLCAFMLDSILTRRGKQNPASFGTFPRLLGRYSRDLKLFSLEEAVRRMTSYSAERMGFTDIGRVEPGYWADLVIFDPEHVDDHTTLRQPEISPTGIKSVLISGNLVAQDGQLVAEKRWGRAMRRS
jgi:N-acyl-D-amino-acid deacylase